MLLHYWLYLINSRWIKYLLYFQMLILIVYYSTWCFAAKYSLIDFYNFDYCFAYNYNFDVERILFNWYKFILAVIVTRSLHYYHQYTQFEFSIIQRANTGSLFLYNISWSLLINFNNLSLSKTYWFLWTIKQFTNRIKLDNQIHLGAY